MMMKYKVSRTKSLKSEGGKHAGLFISAITGLMMQSGVFAQQSYTFTNCSAIGSTGPTQGLVNTAYAATNLNGSVTIGTQGIQQFTIPVSGGYKIEAWGGQGYGASGVGGRGAYMSGEFQFTAGQVLKIIVGQQGELPTNSSYNAQYGGGGGSFVTDLSNTPYIVAGGGGGNWSSNFSSIADAGTGTNGNTSGGAGSTSSSGGTNGSGGGTANSADGGGGMTGNGSGSSAGVAFVNGGAGGFTTYGIGGFGGGGGTSSFNNRRAAGGGGYSGGGGAEGVTTGFPEGGGGGSYNAGTNQVNTAGINTGHGKVIISELCSISLLASTNPICIGNSLNLSTNATGSISWSNGGTTSTISVSPTVTTTYTVTGTGTANCTGYSIITVTVNQLPVISTAVTPTIICVGGTATITASGASTYTWASGPSSSVTTASPLANTVYTVSGTNVYGCVKSNTYSVKVNTNSVSINSSTNTVCAGSPAVLTASGVNSYTWSTGSFFQSISVTPTANAIYSLSGRDNFYCLLTNTISVAVNPKPNITVTADRNLVCKGESVVLTAAGAGNYTWTGNGSGNSITVSLPVDVAYTFTVMGTDANGCKDTTYHTITASKCVGIGEQAQGASMFRIYPNPASTHLYLESDIGGDAVIEIIDVTGKRVLRQASGEVKTRIDIDGLANGLYYIRLQSASGTEVLKLLKQ